MSTPLHQNRHRGTVPADHGFNLSTSTINIGDKYATIQIPIGVWNDGLKDEKKKLKSPDTKIDMKAVTERMSIKIVRTAAVQTLVSQPDPRDDIPLVYSSTKRKIIHLVGFFLSSSAILGVHIAGNAGHVPGFQPLPIFTVDPRVPNDPRYPDPSPNVLLGFVFGLPILVTLILRAIAIWG